MLSHIITVHLEEEEVNNYFKYFKVVKLQSAFITIKINLHLTSLLNSPFCKYIFLQCLRRNSKPASPRCVCNTHYIYVHS